jgi:rhamnosyltransferase
VMIHKPLRLYYIMRNRVLLYGRKETPAVWIAQDLPRLVLKFFGTALFVAPRLRYLRMMVCGLLDGVRGRTGPRCN